MEMLLQEEIGFVAEIKIDKKKGLVINMMSSPVLSVLP
jgi:hypothetical protein